MMSKVISIFVPFSGQQCLRACLKFSNKDSDERKSKDLSGDREFALTIFPKSAEFVKPAK